VVARIGNAAQTLHPVAGQGLNLGLRDAHELIESLRGIGAVSADPQARAQQVRQALSRFERRRQPDRIALIAGTDFLARSFTWTPPVLATLRGLALGVLQKASPAKQALAQMMMFGHR
jgi:2-octaprenyl-6-methoxyphenol hydroxylase